MRKARISVVAAVTAAFAMIFASIALADNVFIDVVANPGSDEVTLDLATGSPQTDSVTIEYLATNDDRKNGCNLQGSGSQVRFDVNVTTVSGTAPTLDKSVVTFPDCVTAQTIGISASAVGVISVSLTYKDHVSNTSPLDGTDWNSTGAAFSVTVIDSTQHASLDAPEIANAYLGARPDNGDCKSRWGTNRNQVNWHGQLINHIAKHPDFQGVTFNNSTKSVVENYVESACTQ